MAFEVTLLIICLFFSAFFAGGETALVSVSNVRIRTLLKKHRRGAKALQRLKSDPRRMITTILIGNNLANIGASALVTMITIDMFGSRAVGISTGLLTLVILIFGDITPKSLATVYGERIALLIARPIELLSKILYPVVILLNKLTSGLLSMMGADKKQLAIVTEEELKSMLAMGVETGEVDKEEKDLIENVFQFNDIKVKDVMTPRINMVCFKAGEKLKDVLGKILGTGFSRIPIYKGTKDNIVGVVYLKDIMNYLYKGKLNVTLKRISMKPYFVPEDKVLSDLFKRFQEKKVHMAIVVDEFGGTGGIITLEDLLEEIMGEITDESDEHQQFIKRIDQNTVLVHGKAEIKEINDFLNVRLPAKSYETISKLMLKHMKKIPKKGEKVKIKDVSLIVQKASKKHIVQVKIIKEEV